jgi:hypothetical protein
LKNIEDKTVHNFFSLNDEDKAGTTRKVIFCVVSLIGLIGFGLLGKLLETLTKSIKDSHRKQYKREMKLL